MLKSEIHQACLDLVSNKISHAVGLMNEAQESANSDTKSSAGDKHETSRAMAMLEKDKAASQLAQANKLKQLLSQINPNIVSKKVGLGSLVKTNNGWFYISVGIGKVTVSGKTAFCMSLASPLGQALRDKKNGDTIYFNQQNIRVEKLL